MRLALNCILALGLLAGCTDYTPAEPLRGVRPSWRAHYEKAHPRAADERPEPPAATHAVPASTETAPEPTEVAQEPPAEKPAPPVAEEIIQARPSTPTGPALEIIPPEPGALDTLQIVRSDGKALEQGIQIRWTRNQIPLETTEASVPGPHSKGRHYKAVVVGRGWKQGLETVIVNTAPEFLGFGNLEREGEGFKVRIRARDADGDSLRLQLPARSPGIQISGMKLLLDPEMITEDRSVPVSITDGEATAAFLYPVRLPR